ncbi:MAG: response regulator [Nitrospirota bacterium]|nr:response regulator [Nitrospirota bacterium]
MEDVHIQNTILIVDDDLGLTTLIQRLLRRKGFHTVTAQTGSQALAWLAQHHAELMLLDLRLPDMNGEELIQALKKRDRALPFIVVTGQGDEQLAVKMIKCGARDYVTKDAGALELLPSVITQTLQQLEQEQRLGAAEQALAEEQERLSITLNAIADGVISTDVFGNIRTINPVAAALTGYTEQDALGQPVEQVVRMSSTTHHEEEHPLMRALHQRQTIKPLDNLQLHARDGTEYTIACSASLLRRQDRKLLGAVFVFQDMTERSRITQELQKAGKLESLGLLAGGIAHDFNNLLMSILGNISMAKRGIPSSQRPFLQLCEAEKASVLAKGLTQQLLTFAKGGFPLKKPTPLRPLLESAMQLTFRGGAIRLELHCSENVWAIHGDDGQLSQAFHNLMINAKQAMPKGGKLCIRAENQPTPSTRKSKRKVYPTVRITIQDTGVGITPEHLPRIFDPYFTTKVNGTGIGLATTYSIIKNHGGKISVDSTPGKGTTIVLTIPASPASTRMPRIADDNTSSGQGKILVMDDEEAIRSLLQEMLTYLGYEVEVVTKGQEALKQYTDAQEIGQPFSAVILDLTIPGGMGGKDTIKKLRKINPNVKAIVCSGYSHDPVLANYQAHGFQAMVAKPFQVTELGDRLHLLLEPTQYAN